MLADSDALVEKRFVRLKLLADSLALVEKHFVKPDVLAVSDALVEARIDADVPQLIQLAWLTFGRARRSTCDAQSYGFRKHC